MYRKVFLLLLLLIAVVNFKYSQAARGPEIIDPEKAMQDPDFSIQGEYLGEETADGKKSPVGAQVIARGKGKFQVVIYSGGLPGAGWKRGDGKVALSGNREENKTTLESDAFSGVIADGKMSVAAKEGKREMELKRVERTSSTLGAKPPKDAMVLFDGSSAENFDHGKVTEMKTLMAGVTTKQGFNDHTLHLEFRLSWMPQAGGQGRSNSGLYLHDCYEIQVLDSFGLEGRNNECGGFYKIREPDVNMCFPPLTWQTYDVEMTAPKYDSQGKKTENARVTVRHNGVVIHKDLELPNGTPGRKREGPGPRPFHLQGHGNKVQYRNIWVVPK